MFWPKIDLLVEKAREIRKLRLGTTVLEANIYVPTDAKLLTSKSIKRESTLNFELFVFELTIQR
jgi:hypothetical protein